MPIQVTEFRAKKKKKETGTFQKGLYSHNYPSGYPYTLLYFRDYIVTIENLICCICFKYTVF